jgi:hypothetical protein
LLNEGNVACCLVFVRSGLPPRYALAKMETIAKSPFYERVFRSHSTLYAFEDSALFSCCGTKDTLLDSVHSAVPTKIKRLFKISSHQDGDMAMNVSIHARRALFIMQAVQ